MRLLACLWLVACWRNAPPPHTQAETETNEPGGPPPETRLVPADPAPPTDRFVELLVEFQGFADQMCQCGDSTCGYAVLGDFQKWSEQQAKDGDMRELKPTAEQNKQLQDIMKRLSECMMKAMASGSAGTGP